MSMVKIWTAGTAILAMYKCIPSPFHVSRLNLAKVRSRRERLPWDSGQSSSFCSATRTTRLPIVSGDVQTRSHKRCIGEICQPGQFIISYLSLGFLQADYSVPDHLIQSKVFFSAGGVNGSNDWLLANPLERLNSLL